MVQKPKILIEADAEGIRKLELRGCQGEAALRLLKNSLPALRLFHALLPQPANSPGEEPSR